VYREGRLKSLVTSHAYTSGLKYELVLTVLVISNDGSIGMSGLQVSGLAGEDCLQAAPLCPAVLLLTGRVHCGLCSPDVDVSG